MIAKAKKEAAMEKHVDKTRAPLKRTMTKAEIARCNRHSERLDDEPVKFELAEVLGTAAQKLQNHLLNQVANIFRGAFDGPEGLVEAMNNALAMLHEIKPRDELEVMLTVQMIAVHNQAMRLLALATAPGQLHEHTKDNLNFTVRMLRMFTTQMETLQKHRTGGEQKVTVEHVHVNEGGQAIVGTVNTGGAARNGK